MKSIPTKFSGFRPNSAESSSKFSSSASNSPQAKPEEIASLGDREPVADVRLRLLRRASQTGYTRLPRSGLSIAACCSASDLHELDRARSRLYRSDILQVNTSMRLKALAEIYTLHSFAQRDNETKRQEERETERSADLRFALGACRAAARFRRARARGRARGRTRVGDRLQKLGALPRTPANRFSFFGVRALQEGIISMPFQIFCDLLRTLIISFEKTQFISGKSS